jgi:hypothetical protein
MIGIQIGAISFVDEGVNKVLDILQEKGSVNTLFISSFTYDLGTGGRKVPGRALPDHGKHECEVSRRRLRYAAPAVLQRHCLQRHQGAGPRQP